MLESTFLHFRGVGHHRERALWARGIKRWADHIGDGDGFRGNGGSVEAELQASRQALSEGDAAFFASRLPKAEHYRIALAYPAETLFLDIETTGLSLYYDDITIIGASLGSEYRFCVAGRSVDGLVQWLERAKCLVTFNGTLFDLKFIRKRYPDLPLPAAHIDLRFFARGAGLRGGQKAVERQIGFAREVSELLTGEAAPVLWHEYRLGNLDAFRTLVEYNRADVEGMKAILDAATERRRAVGLMPDGLKISRFSAFRTKPLVWVNGVAAPSAIKVPRPQRLSPKISYRELTSALPGEGPTVVGIDLTGSAQRPSGWCLLRGPLASTCRVGGDDEIVERTAQARPDLVSIDSPLWLPREPGSLPDGQMDDPPPSIMRACERLLKRRGINVYPCLIPSMRALTHRGIALAMRLRAMGLPVIESYPGAAQDIMGISRKRAGLQHLIRGLAEFGISGDFVNGSASHDEVDAVTSALVGTFFWCGRFEPLGNEDEDYLIIPDLRTRRHAWLQRFVVGISGPISAGKTTAATILSQRGYAYGRYSQVLAAALEQQGRPINRETLQELGDRVNRGLGQRWLGAQLLARFPAEARLLVIDGLRFPEDHAFLKERCGPNFVHVHIDAPRDLREGRYLASGSDAAAFARANAHLVERGSEGLGGLAQIRIANAGTVQALTARLLKTVSTLELQLEA